MQAIEKIETSIIELWNSFLFHVPQIILGLFILVLAFMISRWLSNLFKNRISRRMEDPLLSTFLSRVLRIILVVLGILLAFNVMGLTGIAAGLLAGAGVGALIIGLAFQEIGANFIAGIILAFNRPFSVGDTIEIDGMMGKVVSLSLRATQIKTFDGKDVFIPNNTIVKEELINYTKDGLIRLEFIVGIDYDDDADKAIEVILGSTRKVKKVLQHQGREPIVIIHELATSTVNLMVKFWVETFDYKQGTAELRSQVISQVLKDLVASGIGLPADIVELKHYKGKGFPIRILEAKKPKDP